jgi:biotin carboxylase
VHAIRFRDKDEMKRVLRAAGVPVARSTLANTVGEIADFARVVGYPLIVKPPAGLGSKSTWRVENDADVAALAALGLEAPLQVEQFILGREHTCETISISGKTVWRSGTRYFPTPLEVLENPWMQYCVILPREQTEAPWPGFHPTNEAALQALFAGCDQPGMTALTHMEWFLTADGAMVVGEVGARPPGVNIMPLMSLAHETDFIADWAELIAFDRFTPKPRKWATGTAFFRGQGSGGRVVQVEGLAEATRASGDNLVELKTPKVGMARNSSYEGEGFAIVRGASTEAVKQTLLTLIQTVQIRYG